MHVKIILTEQLQIKYRATMIAIGQNLKYLQNRPKKSGSMGLLVVIKQEGLCFCFRKFSTTACQS